MRLGMVGLLPSDLRQITPLQLETIRSLNLTSASFHLAGEVLAEITPADCQQLRRHYADTAMELAQMGIGYKECLFDPDPTVRNHVITKIERGIEIANRAGAQYCLIRTGSLSERGSYSPSPANHSAKARANLLTTLRQIATKAEQVGQTVVIETHLLTIMDSPETNVAMIEEVGSDRLRIVMDYVNHFQTLAQVYHSAERIHQIFDTMGAICPIGHCKDITVNDGFVIHLSEEIPGEGELDLASLLQRWHALRPDGYMLLEHLSAKTPVDRADHPGQQLGWTPQQMATFDLYAQAARNIHQLATEAGVPIQ